MKLKPTRYVSDTVINAEKPVGEVLDAIARDMNGGKAYKPVKET